ncbi:MAG: ABC transporter ATP-binding protein [Alphaproteobacteria bacterium]|nr:ABC transporter ATP-binding protein [Alphaproteobacteria bacterium]
MTGTALLEVADLRVAFPSAAGMVEAVRGIDLAIAPGEAVGLLGESGSGKSVSSLALMRLVAAPGRVRASKLAFDGHDLLTLGDGAMQALRGRAMAMVFQDPQTALNPAFRVGSQLLHVLRAHERLAPAVARNRVHEILELVGLPDPPRVMRAYPHELSGGMRQRALIGMALIARPRLLIADEPTTALDVTVQAQIVDLFRRLRRELDLTLLFITHNLDLMAELCDRALVMYAGLIVEAGPVEALFAAPRHPYTRMLLECVPRLEPERRALTVIRGMPPRPGAALPGCPFAPRCPGADDRCRTSRPLEQRRGEHRVACWQAAP